MSGKSFANLSDDVLFGIFQYLTPRSLLQAAQCCSRWKRIAFDDLLWRDLVRFTYKIPAERMVLPEYADSWFSEFKRLDFHTPSVESEVLRKHIDEVLHVSFSHDGKHFATSSKDSTVKLWELSWPTILKHDRDMSAYNWGHVMLSEFNQSDTLLLVSGVMHRSEFNGQVAIIDIKDRFQVIRQIDNRPYDIFGIWLDDENIITGKFHWFPARSELFINKTFLSAPKEFMYNGEQQLSMKLATFRNHNENCIRVPMIADCPSDTNCCDDKQQARGSCSKTQSKSDFSERVNSGLKDGSKTASNKRSDKYLIYWTGEKSCVPNQLGIKRFSPQMWLAKIEEVHKRRFEGLQNRNRNSSQPSEYDSSDFDSDSDLEMAEADMAIRDADHTIDFDGRIIGVKLSKDQRYLFVNVRAWPADYVITDPLRPPEISHDIEIHTIDLTTMTNLGVKFSGHKGLTADEGCFLMYIDTCDKYISSGSEDKKGYIWDRHYGVLLRTLPSDDVVSAAVFNPCDPETIVTVGDDYSIRIFRSRNRHWDLNIGTRMDIGSSYYSADPVVEQCVTES